jgi:hydrogenase nickel incorporation protein HypB
MEIKVVKKVLSANDTMAQQNRKYFSEKKVFVLNMMSSPGSGKTSILEKTVGKLLPEINSAIIVGDVCTTNDADRLAKTGVPVIQICTDDFGGDCHLAAHVVGNAAFDLDLDGVNLLIVENVGNLVCPAEFDIGEDARVVVLSVTEGEDKPLKYPVMFRVCDAALLNKTDLLPYLDFDMEAVVKNIRQIHPDMSVFEVSAKTQDGFSAWIDWLKKQVEKKVG